MKEIHRMGSVLRKGCTGTPLEVKFRSRPLRPAEKATGEGAGEWGEGTGFAEHSAYRANCLTFLERPV